MAKHKFPYSIRDAITTPRIKVHIGYKNEWKKVLVLLDSGADISLFRREIGEGIGINIEKGILQKFRGIGKNGLITYIHNIKLKIDEDVLEIMGAFAKDRKWDVNIIGRKDVFNKMVITFKYDKEIIIKI